VLVKEKQQEALHVDKLVFNSLCEKKHQPVELKQNVCIMG